MKKENEEIIEKIVNECNWWERIILRRNKKLIIKAYKIGITFGFNNK